MLSAQSLRLENILECATVFNTFVFTEAPLLWIPKRTFCNSSQCLLSFAYPNIVPKSACWIVLESLNATPASSQRITVAHA